MVMELPIGSCWFFGKLPCGLEPLVHWLRENPFVEASGLFRELVCTDLVVVSPHADFPFEGKVELLDKITPVRHSARRGAQ
jgi:hypothetical protein